MSSSGPVALDTSQRSTRARAAPHRRTAVRRAPRRSASARCFRCTGTRPAPVWQRAHARRVGAGSSPGPDVATCLRSTAARRSAPDRGCSRCRAHRQRCDASTQDHRRAAGGGGRTPGSGAGLPMRRARPPGDRCAPTRSTAATATDAPPAAEIPAVLSRHVPPGPSLAAAYIIHQSKLMRLGRSRPTEPLDGLELRRRSCDDDRRDTRTAIASDAGEFALAARSGSTCGGRRGQAATRAWNAGSSRIGSKSESPMANER